MLTRTLSGIVMLAASAALIGCASGEGRERKAPHYASPYGIEGWRVNCGRTKVIIVDDDEVMDQFYKADGTHKSFSEFCRDAEPSLINRRR